MKVLTSVLTVVPLLVIAHGDDYLHAQRHRARQVSSSPIAVPTAVPTSPQPTVPSAPPVVSGALPSSTVNGSVIAPLTATLNSTGLMSLLTPLISTNPTAVPLSSIVSNQSSAPVPSLSSTPVPGVTPSYMSAPPLPTPPTDFANYPPLDKIPATDTPQVQQWIQEVNETGIVIPNFSPTNPGGCPNNTDIALDTDRCWWTCTGCVASFDITTCPTPLNWGLTYDDGPAFYTSNLLEYLAINNLKATFFTVGSRVIEFPDTAQLEYMTGNQISVHTWSHPYMTTLTNEQIIAELGWSKKVIKDVLGVTPNTWRPPYGDIDDRVRAISVAMGLTPIIWTRISPTATFDTGDFNIPAGTITSYEVIENWEYILGNVTRIKTGFIVLEHDLYLQTVELATGYILPDAMAFRPAFNITPVITCLGMPFSNAYIETNNNETNPPVISGTAVTIIHPTATGSTGNGSHSSAVACSSVGFSPIIVTTVVTLLASVIAVRF